MTDRVAAAGQDTGDTPDAADAAPSPPSWRRLLDRLRDLERRTRPTNPQTADALRARWRELPPHVRTPAQMVGRKFTGCEATHGVFPKCNFGCRPCYHAANANQVAIDGDHTVTEVDRQMAYLTRDADPASMRN